MSALCFIYSRAIFEDSHYGIDCLCGLDVILIMVNMLAEEPLLEDSETMIFFFACVLLCFSYRPETRFCLNLLRKAP